MPDFVQLCFFSKYVPGLWTCCLIARENPRQCLQCQWPLPTGLLLGTFGRLWVTGAGRAAAPTDWNQEMDIPAAGDGKCPLIMAHCDGKMLKSLCMDAEPTGAVHWISSAPCCSSLIAPRSDGSEKQMQLWPYFEEWCLFPLLLPKGTFPLALCG